MKKLLLFPFLLFVTGIYAQKSLKIEKVTDHSSLVKGDNFEGIIFDKSYIQNPKDTAELIIKKFTPTDEDIILVEKVLTTKNNDNNNKGDIKYIFNNLRKYRRQYMGYYNGKGEKIIYVNCFPVEEDWANEKIKVTLSKTKIPKWYDHLFYVFDGGRSFWQAHVSLTKKSIIDISINGVA